MKTLEDKAFERFYRKYLTVPPIDFLTGDGSGHPNL